MSETNEQTLTEAGEARDERKKLDADGTHGEVSTWALPALWMLGVDPQTTGLWIAPSERRMLAILTSTVLIPVSMAFCGMVMILSGQPFLAVAFFGAGAWSMMVFTIDRLMLATGMRSKCGAEPDRAQRVRLVNVSGFAVRIALAVLMSFAVTTPIKLWFFEGLVDNHIETTQKIEQDKSAAQASARADQLVKGDLTLATMEKTIIEAQEAIQKERASVEGHQRFYQVRLDEALKENRTLCLRRCKQAKRMAAEYKKN
ncbi:MAG: DUF4407 domain-containing protein, partial [Myxococcales bacterium]|nr:DUF4407 domain-containing protein [Myxococcales bacterium]